MLEHLHKCYEETETIGVGGQKGLNKRGHGSNYFDIIMNAYAQSSIKLGPHCLFTCLEFMYHVLIGYLRNNCIIS